MTKKGRGIYNLLLLEAEIIIKCTYGERVYGRKGKEIITKQTEQKMIFKNWIN